MTDAIKKLLTDGDVKTFVTRHCAQVVKPDAHRTALRDNRAQVFSPANPFCTHEEPVFVAQIVS